MADEKTMNGTGTVPLEVKPEVVESPDEEVSDLRCGYFGWRPKWLQRFNRPSWLIVCIMWFTFTQGKEAISLQI